MRLSFLTKKFEYKGYFCPLKDPSTWKEFIPLENKPINYLEIGVLKGINTIIVGASYCHHADSKIYCVDPWCDYDEYSEYKEKQSQNYNDFLFNINHSGLQNKYIIKKGFSDEIVPTFENDFFDLIFIDGNHETDYVYKDGEMSLQKLKSGGYIVFDDQDWPETKLGINNFLEKHNSEVKIVGNTPFQIFIQKL